MRPRASVGPDYAEVVRAKRAIDQAEMDAAQAERQATYWHGKLMAMVPERVERKKKAFRAGRDPTKVRGPLGWTAAVEAYRDWTRHGERAQQAQAANLTVLHHAARHW